MDKIIELLEKVKLETQDINKSFIYDFLIGNKEEVTKKDFLENSLNEMSNNYEWDEQKVLSNNIATILDDQKFSTVITFEEFIKDLEITISLKSINELKEIFVMNNISKGKINKFTLDSVGLIYPYFDNIYFFDTQNQYILFSLGYVD